MRIKAIVILVVVTFVAFHLSRDTLACYVWEKHGNASLSATLVLYDADLAMQLGNYYFGGASILFGGSAKPEYDLERAKEMYQIALASEPSILWGHYHLARVYFVEGEYNSALEEINLELEHNPENLRALYVRGLIYGYRSYPNDLERAISDFERFVLWAPSEWAGYNDLAWLYMRGSQYTDAERILLQAITNIPSEAANPWLLNSLGAAQLNLKKFNEAIKSFEKAKEGAAFLSIETWRQAYPGNNPEAAGGGLEEFRNAIDENLGKARSAS